MSEKFNGWPYEQPPRDWQQRLFQDYQAARILPGERECFLVNACPAAGKTRATLPLVADALNRGLASRVVIVCPTIEIADQWQREAAKFGIQLSRDGGETRDMHGVVVTYQQVAMGGAHLHRRLCQDKTLVIFDEIHHCGDSRDWGKAIRFAFENAQERIALTGTPFRHDDAEIPFVTYEEGICRADFTYGYQEALDDDVCRLAFFPTVEGEAEWVAKGDRKLRSIAQKHSSQDRSDLLRTILDIRGEWMQTMVVEVRKKTDICRQLGHADAAELWVCLDRVHARSVARLIEQLTGEAPILVLSDDPAANKKIDAFRHGKQKCLVSVRMISEGVNIERLRVLAFATNVLTELFFRQILGRILRMLDGLDEQAAYLYMPAIEPLTEYALRIVEQRVHHLQDRVGADPERLAHDGEEDGECQPPAREFIPIASTGVLGNIVGGGDQFSQEALQQAVIMSQILKTRIGPEELAMGLVAMGFVHRGKTQPETAKEFEEPLETRKYRVKQRIVRLVNQWAALEASDPHAIHLEWVRVSGLRTDAMTLEELRQKEEWVIAGLMQAQERRRND